MAVDLAQAEEYVALAEKHKRILMVGLNRRFMPAYLKAKEFVGGRAVEMARVWKHGANVWGHSLHVVDVLRWFCGEPVSVHAEGNFDDSGKETAVAATIRFDSGAIGTFETTRNYGMRKDELELHGENFTVRVYSPDTVMMYEDGKEVTYRHGKDTWFTEGIVHCGFAQEIDHFLTAVRDKTTPINAAADAIKSHRLAAEIIAAMRANCS